MSHQLSFDLPVRPALGRGDFFVSPSNALAVALIDAPDSWVSGKLVLYGPRGSGKSHLARVWTDSIGGAVISATDLVGTDIPMLTQHPLAVEDVPAIADAPDAQTALFHLHNLMLTERRPLLMTGRDAPDLWRLSLPDLQSRVSGTQAIALEPPDDALLAAVLAKLFADRQIIPRPDVIPYLVAHMDRSFESAARVVAALDRAALSEGRSLSRPLAIRVLDALDRDG